jgi:hypothetical protein
MGVTCMLAWSIYFLVRWWQSPSLVSILLAGLCFGCVPTIRYPDAVMGVGVGAFLVMLIVGGRGSHRAESVITEETARQEPRPPASWVHLVTFCIGAFIPILPLLIRNQLLLGAFWRTGYALTNEQTGFSWAYFREHALAYIQALNSGGVGLLLGLGIVGIVSMICYRSSRALGVMLALICLPMLLLYMAYYWAPQMNSSATMRFLLPTFPAYVLAGVWMLATFLKDAPRGARIAVPLSLLLVQCLWGATDLAGETTRIHYSKQMLARVTEKLNEVAAAGDVVVSNNQVLQNLDFVRKWKLADEQLVRGGPGGAGGPGGGRFGRGMGPDDQDEDAPSPMQRAKREEQQKKYSGSQSDREEKFADDVSRWAGDHNVYLVGSETEVRAGLGDGLGKVKIIARIDPPEAPPTGGPGGGMMGRQMGPGGAINRGRVRFGGPMGGGGAPMGAGGPMVGRRPGMGMDGPQGDREMVLAQWIPNHRAESVGHQQSASR